MTIEQEKKLRVAIVGGGIGGLALALALYQMDPQNTITVDIYEAAAELTQAGAGITLWPRTWGVFDKLGLSEPKGRMLPGNYQHSTVGLSLRKSDQLEGIELGYLFSKDGLRSFHRAQLQELLLENLPKSYRIHLSHRLASYKETNNSVTLKFDNGLTVQHDLIVGADGIKSAVRQSFVTDTCKDKTISGAVVFTGTQVYRGLVSRRCIEEKMPNHRALTTPMAYCGKNKHFITYPILQGQFINIGGLVSDMTQEGTIYKGATVVDVDQEELLSQFSGWEREVTTIIECMEKPSRWAIQTINPVHKYASGRAALLGDAAHAMPPHLGAGAGQAIEDAYILAIVISRFASRQLSLSRALELYNEIRQPIATFVANSTRRQGLLYEFNTPEFVALQESGTPLSAEHFGGMMEEMKSIWAWLDNNSITDDCLRASSSL